jgi:hypothetical protein
LSAKSRVIYQVFLGLGKAATHPREQFKRQPSAAKYDKNDSGEI